MMGAAPIGLFARTRPGLDSPDVQYQFLAGSFVKPGEEMHDFPALPGDLHSMPAGEPRLAQDPLARSRSAARNPAELPIDAGRQGHLDRRASDRARHIPDCGNAEICLRGIPARPSGADDEDFLDHIRQTAGTTYHPTSTCMMGQHERAVVDTELRVQGIEGLRVIDASIMPTVVSGNTNAATIMIAEKGADMILARRVPPARLPGPRLHEAESRTTGSS